MRYAARYESRIKHAISSSHITAERGEMYLAYLYSGGSQLPVHIISKSGRNYWNAACRFRGQFKKVAGVSSSSR
jgi:hypothetical protein